MDETQVDIETLVDILMCKIYRNIDLVLDIKETENLEEAMRLAKELEKQLGIRVLLSTKNLDEYPALVVNRSKHSDTIARLYESRNRYITITESFLDAEESVMCWPYTSE